MSAASVAIRVDSGWPMGSGHLVRCLTLANELRRRGARTQFISREHRGNLIVRIEEAGHLVHRLPAPATDAATFDDSSTWLAVASEQDVRETLTALAGDRIDCLIVDHYAIDAAWERQIRVAAARILVIDDLANRSHDADVLLDQNYLGSDSARRYEGLVPERCFRLLGSRYALLQPVYAQLRRSLPARDGSVHRVLVFFGAQDPTDSTTKVLRALSFPEFAHLSVDVVPGTDPRNVANVRSIAHARRGITIHEGLQSLAPLLMRADLAIGAGGATTWERAVLGVPSIVAVVAANQMPIAQALAKGGFIALAGRSADLSDASWATQLHELIGNAQQVVALGERVRALADGHGAGRVACAALGRRMTTVTVRRATRDDEGLLLDWANDPGVRSMGFVKEPIAPETHHRWFITRLADPRSTLLIGEDLSGMPIGQVRFEQDEEQRVATVHLSVDASLRGQGAGAQLLYQSLEFWRARKPNYAVIAEVLPENGPSQRLFRAAGFAPIAAVRKGSLAFKLESQA